MAPKPIAHRYQHACMPLEHAICDLHQSQGLLAALPGQMPMTCCLSAAHWVIAVPYLHTLLTSARFAQELNRLPLSSLLIFGSLLLLRTASRRNSPHPTKQRKE